MKPIQYLQEQTYWLTNNILYSESYLSMRVAFIAFFTLLTSSIIGLMCIEEMGFIDAFYMTIITLSTVGFTEVTPLHDSGKIFISIVILLNIGVFAYIVSVFTYYFVNGEVFKTWSARLHFNRIQKMKEHIIICGFGRYGRQVAQELLRLGLPHVVIDMDSATLDEAAKLGELSNFIVNDATHEDTLVQAGIENARGLVTALPEDADNVYTVLSARQHNPTLNIVSRASTKKAETKLMLAGANTVVQADQIGGYFLANMVINPYAKDVHAGLTTQILGAAIIVDVPYERANESIRDLSLDEMKFMEKYGVQIIAIVDGKKNVIINPDLKTGFSPNTSLVIMATPERIEAIKKEIEAV